MKRLLLRTKIGSLFVLAFLLLTMVTGAPLPTALAFTYSESVSGDLQTSLPASSVFPFDVGANTVSGTFGVSPTDNDSFAFSVPAGLQLESVSFAFSTTATTNITRASAAFSLYSGNDKDLPNLLMTFSPELLGASPVSAFGGALPLNSGTFAIDSNGFSLIVIGINPFTLSTDYTWTFNIEPTSIAPVPEPSTMLLLGSGLIGLAGYGRKRFFKK